ncbi:MAG: hypothetical protein JWQ73_4236 [Variovorax sp.]|nr:hypothetical protein [Variovorax sp.]
MRFLTDTDDEVFDLLIGYAGSSEIVSEVMARPGRDSVRLPQVIKEIDELLAARKIQAGQASQSALRSRALEVPHTLAGAGTAAAGAMAVSPI